MKLVLYYIYLLIRIFQTVAEIEYQKKQEGPN